MKWQIPAKTFFLGEYAAITGAPAIILTTNPCFELTLTDDATLSGIHPDSPAGIYWETFADSGHGLSWYDPYDGCGGLGASSAQFLGVYLAGQYLRQQPIVRDTLLYHYWQCAWSGHGIRPSGYDVLAQSSQQCVYIHHQQAICQSYHWPFDELGFILLHTGNKLATHQHLQTLNLTMSLASLITIVESAQQAFESADSQRVIDAVNSYHEALEQMGLVASHGLQWINRLRNHADVLAIKGCGAMGSDVLLLLLPAARMLTYCHELAAQGLLVLATSDNLYTYGLTTNNSLIEP
jgi:mevalonate kinase